MAYSAGSQIEAAAGPEEEMDNTEALELASDRADANGVVDQVTAELGKIAAAVDRVSDASYPNMELLEASRAIQSALVSLNNWNGSLDDRTPAGGADAAPLTLREAWLAFRPHDPWDRLRPTSADV